MTGKASGTRPVEWVANRSATTSFAMLRMARRLIGAGADSFISPTLLSVFFWTVTVFLSLVLNFFELPFFGFTFCTFFGSFFGF